MSEIGLDSLEWLDIVARIEKRFGIRIPEVMIEEIQTAAGEHWMARPSDGRKFQISKANEEHGFVEGPDGCRRHNVLPWRA